MLAWTGCSGHPWQGRFGRASEGLPKASSFAARTPEQVYEVVKGYSNTGLVRGRELFDLSSCRPGSAATIGAAGYGLACVKT